MHLLMCLYPGQQQQQQPNRIESYTYEHSEQLQPLVAALTLLQRDTPKFRMDPIEFHVFMMTFGARIISRTVSYTDRLYHLDQNFTGEENYLKAGCLHMDSTKGYMEARTFLQKEYRDPFKRSSAYVDKVNKWPSIKQDDDVALKMFGLFLLYQNFLYIYKINGGITLASYVTMNNVYQHSTI